MFGSQPPDTEIAHQKWTLPSTFLHQQLPNPEKFLLRRSTWKRFPDNITAHPG